MIEKLQAELFPPFNENGNDIEMRDVVKRSIDDVKRSFDDVDDGKNSKSPRT